MALKFRPIVPILNMAVSCGYSEEGLLRFLRLLRFKSSLSERAVADRAELARETVRSIESDVWQGKVQHLEALAQIYGRHVLVAIVPEEPPISEVSTVAVSMHVCQDGFDSWKIHFMNLVDEFRRGLDPRLILLPPVAQLDLKLHALLAAIVAALCEEVELDVPDWARREMFLPQPWFVSGMESLKAMALLESPLPFRRNNIFVHENFLARL